MRKLLTFDKNIFANFYNIDTWTAYEVMNFTFATREVTRNLAIGDICRKIDLALNKILKHF